MLNEKLVPYVRPGLSAAKPYDARHHDFAWRHPELERLMSNESPLPPSEEVVEAARAALADANRYPDSGEDLRGAIAGFVGVDPSMIVLGNGSTEILDVAIRTFIGPGDEAVIHVPTYAFFETQVRIHGGSPILVPMTDDFRFDPPALAGAVNERTKLICLCSPNNPTGNSWTVEELSTVLRAGVPTIVDQAYLECGYSPSFASLVLEYPNLIVTRTLSKAFGLAALRLGYGIADAGLVDVFLRIRIPFSISLIALRAGMAALADPDALEERRRYISSERAWIEDRLAAMPDITALPSDGNFVLIDVSRSGRKAAEVVAAAQAEGVLLRAMTAHRLEGNYVRVTVGTHEQNEHFLRVFDRSLRADTPASSRVAPAPA